MNTKDCFKKRLLRRSAPDLLKSEKALDISQKKLERAYELFENGFYEEVIVTSYTSMFQAARSLLFNDGIIEKSHICVVLYLYEKYSSKLGRNKISWLDAFRVERHESFYGLENSEIESEDAEGALEKNEKFIETVCLILEKAKPELQEEFIQKINDIKEKRSIRVKNFAKRYGIKERKERLQKEKEQYVYLDDV